jgi:putative ABC transport system permease protein
MAMIDSVLRDIRYSIRLLRKSPAFFIVAVSILGLGIGANTVMFSVVNAVVVRPLPFPGADRLVQVWHVPPPAQFPGARTFSVSPANYFDWRAQNDVFERMAIYTRGNGSLTGPGQEPVAIRAGVVSVDFFDVLGVKPVRGRLFKAGEDERGQDDVVLISEALWQTRFGGDAGLLGRAISVNGRPRTVVGIIPNPLTFPAEAGLWMPLVFSAEQRTVRGIHDFTVVARLKTDASIARAQAAMDTISRRLERQYPADNTGWGALVISLQDDLVGDTRTALLLLLGAVGFVMLIAAANLANLLLAKTLGRAKEIAVRTALGAGRYQIVQQMLCETLLLGLMGGALGLVLAKSSLMAIVAFVAQELPRAGEINLDASVLAFTFGVSLVVGVVAGLMPAWQLTRSNVQGSLKRGLTRTVTNSSERRVRNALVTSEVALALVLLVGAGLLIRTIGMLRAVDPGFDPRNVLTVLLVAPPTRYPTPLDTTRFFNRVMERIQAMPGVETASAIDFLPLTGGSTQPVAAEGAPQRVMSEQPEVAVRRITPGYLRATKTRLVAGRDFTDADAADRSPVVLVSESMARQFWPTQTPIGRRLTLTFTPGVVWEVVGVIGDVKLRGLGVREPVAALYAPFAQRPGAALSLVVRTLVPPQTLASSIAAAVHAIDPDLPLINVRTLDEVVGASIAQQRFAMQLLAAFAALALFLAAVGIYSVLSYTVRQRVQEIGIRMALGAPASGVVRMVVLEGLKPTLVGLMVGVAIALALGRLLSTMIFGVTPHDAATLAAVATMTALVGIGASLGPAYRATQIDPLIALREEL